MADISKITLPSGNTYNIKDTVAREKLEAITGGDALVFVGVSSTAITDGGTEVPTITGSNITSVSNLKAGNIVFYKPDGSPNREFIWDGEKWQMFDAAGTLGSLAYKSSATASYKPAGTITQPTFTGNTLTSTGKLTPAGTVAVSTNATTNKTAAVSTASGTATYTPGGTVGAPTISVKTAGATNNTLKPVTAKSMVSGLATATPGATAPANAITYYSVADETLSLYQIGATKADSVTLGNAVTVKTGDAEYQASQPSFTGTGVRLITGNIPVPSSYTATFTGTEGNVSVSGTPSGSVSQPTFTGTKVQISGTTTAAGSVSQPTFNGTTATITVS